MMKPILMDTVNVRAILEGRKTVTRRKPFQVPDDYNTLKGMYRDNKNRLCALFQCADDPTTMAIYAPYQPDDILWVRETWVKDFDVLAWAEVYLYRADYNSRSMRFWKPSIHMPREAARIFLRVTGVRVERLRDMTLADVLMEGIKETDEYEKTWDRWHQTWNHTIKPAELPAYGWEANPWVWVIAFERISREEAMGNCGRRA